MPDFAPSVFALLRNRAFKSLLLPLFLDTFAAVFYLFTLHIFVREVLDPFDSCTEDGVYPKNDKCKDSMNNAMFYGVIVVLAYLCTPLWRRLILAYSKRSVWLFYSVTFGLSMCAFCFAGFNSKVATLIGAVLSGISLGGFFLGAVIAAETSDYDELISSRRATTLLLAMLSSLLQGAFLLTLMLQVYLFDGFDYKLPVRGVPQEQSSDT